MKTYRILYIEEKEIHDWTLEQILSHINQDRSEGWTDYTEADWIEGWNEWVEGEFYRLIGETPMSDAKVTAEDILEWHGSDHTIEELVEVMADILNGDYPLQLTKKEIINY